MKEKQKLKIPVYFLLDGDLAEWLNEHLEKKELSKTKFFNTLVELQRVIEKRRIKLNQGYLPKEKKDESNN